MVEINSTYRPVYTGVHVQHPFKTIGSLQSKYTNAHSGLSLQAWRSLELITLIFFIGKTCIRNESNSAVDIIKQEFAGVFKRLGLFPGEHSINIDPTLQTVVHPLRRVPLALQPKLKEELDSMVRQGVIKKIDEPTDLVDSLIIVEKPHTNRLQICLDPCDIKKVVKHEHCCTPLLDNVTSKLAGAKSFGILGCFFRILASEARGAQLEAP